jgi:prepilin-type N-terminal cleavage/methylation domain-containing protein
MTRRAGFSLVELMVVIFIIGMLVALILPAIQAARESSRRVHCRNNLKQLALAAIGYERDHRSYATHDEGLQIQPTWIVSLFPYIEEDALYDEWCRAVGYRSTPLGNNMLPQVVKKPVTILYCPSRRPAIAYPMGTHIPGVPVEPSPFKSGSRTDYAINGGASAAPDDLKVKWPGIWQKVTQPGTTQRVTKPVRAKDVKDGLSFTYLIGEKAVSSDNYETGIDPGDSSSIYECRRASCVRFAKRVPAMDIRLADNCWSCHNFGSAHLTHWNVAYCDGSVHALSYEMSFPTHQALASRAARDRGDFPD